MKGSGWPGELNPPLNDSSKVGCLIFIVNHFWLCLAKKDSAAMPSTDERRTSMVQTDLGLENDETNNVELQNCYGQDVWSEYDLKEPKIYWCVYVS